MDADAINPIDNGNRDNSSRQSTPHTVRSYLMGQAQASPTSSEVNLQKSFPTPVKQLGASKKRLALRQQSTRNSDHLYLTLKQN